MKSSWRPPHSSSFYISPAVIIAMDNMQFWTLKKDYQTKVSRYGQQRFCLFHKFNQKY